MWGFLIDGLEAGQWVVLLLAFKFKPSASTLRKDPLQFYDRRYDSTNCLRDNRWDSTVLGTEMLAKGKYGEVIPVRLVLQQLYYIISSIHLCRCTRPTCLLWHLRSLQSPSAYLSSLVCNLHRRKLRNFCQYLSGISTMRVHSFLSSR